MHSIYTHNHTLYNENNDLITIPTVVTTPLIHSDLGSIIPSNIKNILLIDSSVSNYQTFVNSVNLATFPIVYSYNSTKTDLLNLLKDNFLSESNSIERLALCFTSSSGKLKTFLDNKTLFTDNEVAPFSENVQFILEILNTFNIKNIDFLACDTLNHPTWLNYYNILQNNTSSQVIVGASNDKTGNIKYGGDWEMESTGQNVELTYFNTSIEYYSSLLDNAVGTWTPYDGRFLTSAERWQSITSSSDCSKAYAVVTNGDIYISSNSGATWTPTGNSNLNTKYWQSITCSSDGSKVYAVVYGGDIYVSTNSGVTWTPTGNSSLNTKYWQSITCSSDGSNVYAVSSGDIYVSTNYGAT